MTKTVILFSLISIVALANISAAKYQNYAIYHKNVIKAEKHIASENYADALLVYEQLFDKYDFIFLREYQVATQLALYVGDKQKAYKYLQQGILSGWEMKSIKKNKYLSVLRKGECWKSIKKEYPKLRKEYEAKLNQKLREEVKKMYLKDQRKAINALFRFSSDAQDKYAEKKFAPHSVNQYSQLLDIYDTYGYPGEKLIGNGEWMSTILCHHNSISSAYNNKDTLYLNLKPKLISAIRNGQMSPYKLAIIDDWYISVKSNRTKPSYGILDLPSSSNLLITDQLRESIYVRPYELKDTLLDVEKKTGMNFYLSDIWY